MAKVNEDIIRAALDDGWLFRGLTETERLYLNPTVITVNSILLLIQREGAVTVARLQNKTGLHKNTLFLYLRILVRLKLVRTERQENSNEYRYLLRPGLRHGPEPAILARNS